MPKPLEWLASLRVELDNGKNFAVSTNVDWDDDDFNVKEFKPLIDRWIEENTKIQTIVDCEGLTWEQACNKYYE